MIVIDTSALIDSLTGPRRSGPRLRSFVEAAERLVVPALVLYEWRRGPRLEHEPTLLVGQDQLWEEGDPDPASSRSSPRRKLSSPAMPLFLSDQQRQSWPAISTDPRAAPEGGRSISRLRPTPSFWTPPCGPSTKRTSRTFLASLWLADQSIYPSARSASNCSLPTSTRPPSPKCSLSSWWLAHWRCSTRLYFSTRSGRSS